MGDNNQLYVAKELVPAYKHQIISLATVLTPNQYEAELLTVSKLTAKNLLCKPAKLFMIEVWLPW